MGLIFLNMRAEYTPTTYGLFAESASEMVQMNYTAVPVANTIGLSSMVHYTKHFHKSGYDLLIKLAFNTGFLY